MSKLVKEGEMEEKVKNHLFNGILPTQKDVSTRTNVFARYLEVQKAWSVSLCWQEALQQVKYISHEFISAQSNLRTKRLIVKLYKRRTNST